MRENYWDAWKGLAMIAVVLIHASGESSGFSQGSGDWYFSVIFRQIINFAVPIFLSFAGFFAVKSADPFGSKPYRHRLRRVVPPYFFWTVVYIAALHPEHLYRFDELLKDFMLGSGIGVGYFVVVLVQYVLITPLIQRIKDDQHHFLVMVIGFATAMLATYHLRINQPESELSQFPVNAVLFLTWYPFFHLGVYAAQKDLVSNSTLSRLKYPLLATYVALVAASTIEALVLSKFGLYSFGQSQIKVTSFLASVSLFLLIVSFYQTHRLQTHLGPLAWIGRNSYAIFLTHLLFLRVAQYLLANTSSNLGSYPLSIFLAAAWTLAACTAFV
jgi:surface polysaccharide O-acyltransferase-like enzyme